MDLLDIRFTAHNVHSDFEQPENISDYFSLTAPPNSKIWRKPAHQDDNSAPMIITCLDQPFILAEVTVSADFEMDWDQGGLVIFAGPPPCRAPSSPMIGRRRFSQSRQIEQSATQKWVKAGLEFTGGELGLSTVVANPSCGADWSFTPAFPHLTPEEAYLMYMPSLRIKLERVGDDLWVWFRVPESRSVSGTYRSPELVSRGWKKAREIMGFFHHVEIKRSIWVGCYASRPMLLEDESNDDGLVVEFEDLEIL